MEQQVFLLFTHLVHFGFGLKAFSHTREYHYVDHGMSWNDAQRYCRTHYTDLATFDSMDDINKLNRPETISSGVWIGLNDDPSSWKGTMGHDANSWRWSATGTFSSTGYHRFQTYPTFEKAKQTCVTMKEDGWHDSYCRSLRYPVCFQVNSLGNKEYFLIDRRMTRDDASSYCRTHYKDLAMIENDQEDEQVNSLRLTHLVWIGLYREPWKWSDESNSTFKNWLSGEPQNSKGNEHCVYEDSNHLWADVPCNLELPFLCYRALKPTTSTSVKIRMKSSADLSDPAVSAQILKQLEERLKEEMPSADFKLRWTVSPEKEQEKEKKDNEPTCAAFP